MGYKIVSMKAKDLAFIRDTLEGLNVERVFDIVRNTISEISKFLEPFSSLKPGSWVEKFELVCSMLRGFVLMGHYQQFIFSNDWDGVATKMRHTKALKEAALSLVMTQEDPRSSLSSSNWAKMLPDNTRESIIFVVPFYWYILVGMSKLLEASTWKGFSF